MKMSVDRALQIEWWDVEDMLFHQTREQWLDDVRACRHPDAQCLASLFPSGASTARDDMVRVLDAQGDDARAVFLSGRLTYSETKWLRAAQLGSAEAQAMCAWFSQHCNEADSFHWAQKSASQGSRWGMFRLGDCYNGGLGCEKDAARGRAYWKAAAELGLSHAHYHLGYSRFVEGDWERYVWWAGAALLGNVKAISDLAVALRKQLPLYDEGRGSGRVMFELGAAYSRLLLRDDEVWSTCSDMFVASARRCAHLHEQWLAMAREAISCWLMLARRLGVAKDVRVLIGRKVWEERREWSKCRLD
jgi:TPR repeat protein